MSITSRDTPPKRLAASLRRGAPLFAALGDPTRLLLLARLADGRLLSISRLTTGLALTRQAITKHLRVLQGAGLVRGVRKGRERLFALDPRRLAHAGQTLEAIAKQWDFALGRLKTFVEGDAR